MVVHKKNGGLSDARNAGVKIASGECIVFVDSDDYIDCDMIGKMYDAMLKDDSNVVSCSVKWVEENGTVISESTVDKDEILDTNEAMLEIIIDSKLKQHVWNKMYKTDNAKLLSHDASTALVEGVRTKLGIVKIGNNVFIGANSIVLCNVRIGDNVVGGANSVVTHDVPSNSVYAGNSAKYICSFDEFSEKHQNNQETHPIFRKYRWYEWSNASFKEKERMRKELTDKFGYL